MKSDTSKPNKEDIMKTIRKEIPGVPDMVLLNTPVNLIAVFRVLELVGVMEPIDGETYDRPTIIV